MTIRIASLAALALWLACHVGKAPDDDDDGSHGSGITTAAAGGSTPAPSLCSDDCEFAFDGVCDDGGPDSRFAACAYGTDCADCGPRDDSSTSVTTTTVTTGPSECAPMGADCSAASCCFDGAHLLSCYSGDGGTPYCCMGTGSDCGWARSGICCGGGACVSTDGVSFVCEPAPD